MLSSQITLLPYTTPSVTLLSPTQAESTLSPSPTTEPIVYTVVAGDSLSAIALRFGVNLDALIATNPAINPNAMSIGSKLIIPSSNNSSRMEETTIAGLPTPVIQLTAKPDCYHMDADTWICFLMVDNDQSAPIEDVTGKIIFSNMSASFPVTCPLDIIPAGASLPLVATIDKGDIN
ncbi:MAG: LysM domain-containing protein, partial [Anaerolineaceae bacterium]